MGAYADRRLGYERVELGLTDVLAVMDDAEPKEIASKLTSPCDDGFQRFNFSSESCSLQLDHMLKVRISKLLLCSMYPKKVTTIICPQI